MSKQKQSTVKAHVLEAFEAHFGEVDGDPLEMDPNDFDLDPVPFYEGLSELFDVDFDEDNDNFGGFGGTIAETIAFIVKHWDGKTLNTADDDDMDDDDDDEDDEDDDDVEDEEVEDRGEDNE